MLQPPKSKKPPPRFPLLAFVFGRKRSSEEWEIHAQGFRRKNLDTIDQVNQGQFPCSRQMYSQTVGSLSYLLACKDCGCRDYYEWTRGNEVRFSCYQCGHVFPLRRCITKSDGYHDRIEFPQEQPL